jgi:hypothetical protein
MCSHRLSPITTKCKKTKLRRTFNMRTTMSDVSRLIILLLAFLSLAVVACADPRQKQSPSPSAGCSVALRVIDSATEPVEGAEVSISFESSGQTRHKILLTDKRGKVLIDRLPKSLKQPIQMTASYLGRTSSTTFDPSGGCHGTSLIVLPDRTSHEER